MQGTNLLTGQSGTEDLSQLTRNTAAKGGVDPGVGAAVETGEEHQEGESWTWRGEKEQGSAWELQELSHGTCSGRQKIKARAPLRIDRVQFSQHWVTTACSHVWGLPGEVMSFPKRPHISLAENHCSPIGKKCDPVWDYLHPSLHWQEVKSLREYALGAETTPPVLFPASSTAGCIALAPLFCWWLELACEPSCYFFSK